MTILNVGMVWHHDCVHMRAEWEELFQPDPSVLGSKESVRHFVQGREVTIHAQYMLHLP